VNQSYVPPPMMHGMLVVVPPSPSNLLHKSHKQKLARAEQRRAQTDERAVGVG
jgi:hypothetical protein